MNDEKLQEVIQELELEESKMKPEEIKSAVDAHTNEIARLQELIAEAQSQCKHNDIEIKLVSEGTTQLLRVCKTCGSHLGWPTQAELREAGY